MVDIHTHARVRTYTQTHTHIHTHKHTHTHTHTYTYTPTHYKMKLVPAGEGLLRLKGHENIIKSGDHSKKCNKNANLLLSTHF